jgi:cobalt/nickel transport system permease protein
VHEPDDSGLNPAASTAAPARLDVRVRVIVGLAATVVVVASTQPALPLAAFVLSLVVLLMSRVPFSRSLRRLLGPLAMAAILAIIKAFAGGVTVLWAFNLAGWTLTLTREGLAGGVLLGSRVLGSIGLAVAIFGSIPPHEFFAALRWCRIPRSLVEIALLMCRYIGSLFEQAGSIRAAQRVRLGYARPTRSLASAGVLAGSLALRSIEQADRTHDAMVVRGYRGRMPLPPLPPLARRDWATLSILLILLAAAFWFAGGAMR